MGAEVTRHRQRRLRLIRAVAGSRVLCRVLEVEYKGRMLGLVSCRNLWLECGRVGPVMASVDFISRIAVVHLMHLRLLDLLRRLYRRRSFVYLSHIALFLKHHRLTYYYSLDPCVECYVSVSFMRNRTILMSLVHYIVHPTAPHPAYPFQS